MEEKKPKVQVQSRLETLKVPADKLTWYIMTMSPDEMEAAILDGKWLAAIENPKAPAAKQALTRFKLSHEEGFDDMRPTNFFDYAVLAICATARKEGWGGLTINQICRVLTHSDSRNYISDAVKAAVRASIERMMMTRITIDLSDTAEKTNYKFKRLSITGTILPCRIEDWEVNGQKATYIKFLDDSPLMEVAEAKNHILTIGTKLLDVAGMHNSEMTIECKWHLVFLAMRKKQHPKGMNPSLTFKALYEHTDTANAPRWKRKRIRDEFLRVLDKLKAEGTLDYEIVMDGKIYKAVTIL